MSSGNLPPTDYLVPLPVGPEEVGVTLRVKWF